MSHIRVVCSATLYGQLCQNVLHLINHSEAFTLQQIAGDVLANYVTQVAKRQNSELRWSSIVVTDLSNPLVATFSQVIDVPGGSFSSNSIPSWVSYVIKLQTDRAGRHGRGRIYVPGVNFNSNEKNFFTPAEVAAWEANVFPAFRSAYLAQPHNTLELCVREASGQMNPCTTAQLRTKVGCMRKRQPGVGV